MVIYQRPSHNKSIPSERNYVLLSNLQRFKLQALPIINPFILSLPYWFNKRVSLSYLFFFTFSSISVLFYMWVSALFTFSTFFSSLVYFLPFLCYATQLRNYLTPTISIHLLCEINQHQPQPPHVFCSEIFLLSNFFFFFIPSPFY